MNSRLKGTSVVLLEINSGHLEDRWATMKKTPEVQRIFGGWPKSIPTDRSAWNKRLNPTLGCLN
jgi:hypothetical protein